MTIERWHFHEWNWQCWKKWVILDSNRMGHIYHNMLFIEACLVSRFIKAKWRWMILTQRIQEWPVKTHRWWWWWQWPQLLLLLIIVVSSSRCQHLLVSIFFSAGNCAPGQFNCATGEFNHKVKQSHLLHQSRSSYISNSPLWTKTFTQFS